MGIIVCLLSLGIMRDLAQEAKNEIRRNFGYIQAVHASWAYKLLTYDEAYRKLQERGFQNISLHLIEQRKMPFA